MNEMKSKKNPMQVLKEELEIVLTAIPKKSKIIYIDYPVHGNVGDILIMKGTEQFFKDNNIEVLKRYSVLNYKENLNIPSDCIIVCHGGGNFGDLYFVHQNIRKKIVASYPQNRVVILPQTIHYNDKNELTKDAEIFNKHKDLHFFVRDKKSYELASEYFNNNKIYLSPDMAHQLWKLEVPTVSVRSEELNFIRTDIEKNKKVEDVYKNKKSMDWKDLYSKLDYILIKLIVLLSKLDRKLGGTIPVYKFWEVYTNYIVNKSVRLFSSYSHINTSRLHGHILSCLISKSNILIDNSYGKNSSYYNAWTSDVKNSKIIKLNS